MTIYITIYIKTINEQSTIKRTSSSLCLYVIINTFHIQHTYHYTYHYIHISTRFFAAKIIFLHSLAFSFFCILFFAFSLKNIQVKNLVYVILSIYIIKLPLPNFSQSCPFSTSPFSLSTLPLSTFPALFPFYFFPSICFPSICSFLSLQALQTS